MAGKNNGETTPNTSSYDHVEIKHITRICIIQEINAFLHEYVLSQKLTQFFNEYVLSHKLSSLLNEYMLSQKLTHFYIFGQKRLQQENVYTSDIFPGIILPSF